MALEDANLTDINSDAEGKRTWGTKITVDGTSYATSLFWQPLQNQDDPFTEVGEASEGILEGADLFCIKPGKAPQFGICVSHEGYKSGENVAAVALATALSDRSSFVAVFQTDKGWWYTCVRNDIILSDGDMLFLNEEDAKNQFISMLAVPDWGRKIAPAAWGIEETEDIELEKLMQRGLHSKLQKIKGLRGATLLMVIGISAVVVFWLLSNIINALFFTPKKRPVIVPVQPKIIKPVVEKAPEVKPWERLNDPSQIMSECMAKIEQLVRIMPPGWQIGNLNCTPAGVSTSWSRQIGRLSWVKKALDVSGIQFSYRTFSDTGDSIAAGVSLGKIVQISSPPLKSPTELREILNDFFQGINQNVSLSDGSYTSPEKNIYRFIGFRFSSTYNPEVWSGLLTKFSGLEIKVINYSPSTNIWTYEGAIYAL